MSKFVTDEIEDKVRSTRMAKHVVMRSILREFNADIKENELNDLLLRIYQLFYDSSMVSALFSEIEEREEQKRALQEMDLEDIAAMAFGAEEGVAETSITDFTSFFDADESAFQSLLEVGESIPYEKVYSKMKEAKIAVIIDFFSAFQGSTSSLWEVTYDLSEVDKKQVIDMFSLFVEKHIEDDELNGDQIDLGKDLGTSALNIDIAEYTSSIFLYSPKKWLDKGQTHRLSLGMLIHFDWAKYIPLLSTQISEKLNELSDIILGTSEEDLSNIPFRLVELTTRKNVKDYVKALAEYIIRCSLAWVQIQSSTTL
ncbi:MAG: hypothetical protein ACW97W_09230 [Candidatus Hodarchaeales archaeon]|jgi:hypothetical protein